MILPKHCPYFNERRAAKRRRAVRLSKCCSFGIYCLFGCFKSCLGHSCVASAGPFSSLLFSQPLLCSALLCSAAEWAPCTHRSSVFRGEWLNHYQRNTLESKCSVRALDKCELCSENTREGFCDLAGSYHFVYLEFLSAALPSCAFIM